MWSPLLAIGWEELFRLMPFIIALLVWAINRFAGATPPKPPQRKPVPEKPAAVPGNKPAGDPLQSEIDEFLQQAKSLRENKPASQRTATFSSTTAAKDRNKPAAETGSSSRQSQQRPPFLGPGKRSARRESTRPSSRTAPPPLPDATAATPSRPARETVAEHVAQAMDSSKFDRRDVQLNQSQQDSDAEFRAHMQRVFQREIGTLKPEAGIFEAAAASAATLTAAATAKAVASAGGSETATAPVAIRQGASDIALFLAGRKNIRDAVILSEILQRPVQRW